MLFKLFVIAEKTPTHHIPRGPDILQSSKFLSVLFLKLFNILIAADVLKCFDNSKKVIYFRILKTMFLYMYIWSIFFLFKYF
jgi:hypothetical protein